MTPKNVNVNKLYVPNTPFVSLSSPNCDKRGYGTITPLHFISTSVMMFSQMFSAHCWTDYMHTYVCIFEYPITFWSGLELDPAPPSIHSC